MCCIFCEEPVRSITIGLAAIGLVCVINGARKMLASRASDVTDARQTTREDTRTALETESAT
jgi:hypothetical protein